MGPEKVVLRNQADYSGHQVWNGQIKHAQGTETSYLVGTGIFTRRNLIPGSVKFEDHASCYSWLSEILEQNRNEPISALAFYMYGDTRYRMISEISLVITDQKGKVVNKKNFEVAIKLPTRVVFL